MMVMSESPHRPSTRAGTSPGPTAPRLNRSTARPGSKGLLLAILVLGAWAQAGSAQGPAAAAGDPALRTVVVWPPGPLEVIAAFDRPIGSDLANWFVGRTIPYREAPAADAPRRAAALPSQPSGALRIVAARLRDEGRTLVLATDPHPRVARYLLPLPGRVAAQQEARAAGRPDEGRARAGAESLAGPKPAADVTAAMADPYDLTGVEAAWSEADAPDGQPRWSGWWPHLDVEATRRLTRSSKPHEAGLALLSRPGRLVVSTLVVLPRGPVALRLDATGPIEEALLGDARAEPADPGPEAKAPGTVLTVDSQGAPLFLSITARTGSDGRPFTLKVSYRVADEKADHPLGRERLMVPWAPILSDPATAAPLAVPDLSGGDPARGQAIFAGVQARCEQCHAFRGRGGAVGPDLTEIGSKGRAEIYRDIAAPSAAIRPDYTSYTVATQDGRIAVGVVRAEGADAIRVTDTNAHATIIRRDEIQEIRPSATSIMPPGLASALGDTAVRDLIAFLTTPPAPRPATGR
jgi:putative heme-binding domain-containing protein